MKIRTFSLSLIALALAGASSLSHANESGFYDRKTEGWFWYNEEPEPEPEIIEDPLPPPVVEIEAAPTKPKPQTTEPSLEPFSAEWVRVMLPKYQDKAWSDPSVENVRAYYYLQRFAIDRSEQFALASQLAVMGDPLLDETARRPHASFAVHELDRKKDDETRRVVKEIAQRAGIFFFFAPGCDSCEIQAPMIRDLQNLDGFTIVPISKGGARLNSVTFEGIREDSGHSDQLGVMTFPATYLATPDGQFSVVGQGAYSLSELRQRILLAAKAAKIITDDEFGRTRPILNHDTNIADNLLPEQLEKFIQDNPESTKEDGMVPGSELVKFFRSNKGLKP